jgi:3-hydroxyacyl-CoA dehydrogenase/enoyl-CoA hydratase/3-hydroxybutyryl-CoA epimerase
LWPGLAELLPKKLSRDEIDALDVDELKRRFLAVQAVEAARTLEEKVVIDVREADVGSVLGFGFAPWSGGTLSYIDMIGAKAFVDLCRKFEKKYGARFAPPKLLIDMAAKGDTFYGRFAPKKKKEAA